MRVAPENIGLIVDPGGGMAAGGAQQKRFFDGLVFLVIEQGRGPVEVVQVLDFWDGFRFGKNWIVFMSHL
jgi:hypothetical protein